MISGGVEGGICDQPSSNITKFEMFVWNKSNQKHDESDYDDWQNKSKIITNKQFKFNTIWYTFKNWSASVFWGINLYYAIDFILIIIMRHSTASQNIISLREWKYGNNNNYYNQVLIIIIATTERYNSYCTLSNVSFIFVAK